MKSLETELIELLKEWESERERLAKEALKDTHQESIRAVLSGWNQCYGQCIIKIRATIKGWKKG